MMATTTSLALAALLTLAQEEAAPPEPPAPAVEEAPPPAEPAPTAAAPEEAPREEAPAPEKRELSRITLKDGQVLRGVVTRQDDQAVVVELATGGRMELPAQLVASVETEPTAQVRDNGEVWF